MIQFIKNILDAVRDWTKEKLANITKLIPNQASESNQLADKAFVNSTIQTATANYRGSWSNWSSVPTDSTLYPEDYAGNKTPTVNDYLVVQNSSDYTGLTGTWRFKYAGNWSTLGKTGWKPEYQVNEEPLTAAQIAALNSGATKEIIDSIEDKIDKTVPSQSGSIPTLASDGSLIDSGETLQQMKNLIYAGL